MKKLIILAVPMCAFLLLGCATGSAAKMVKALGNDPAGFSLNIDTLYGKIHLVRANPGTNTRPYKLSPDGSVQVLDETFPIVSDSHDQAVLEAVKRIPITK